MAWEPDLWYYTYMNPKISPEQRRALDEHGGQPIVVVDPDRQQRFVLIADTDYRVRDFLGDTKATRAGRVHRLPFLSPVAAR